MSKRKAGRLGFVAASLLCLLSLALPYCYGKEIDRWLQENGGEWYVQPGTLSAEGQQNPLAYALYRNRFLADTGIETSSDAGQTGKQLLEKTEALAAAGALPQKAAEQARTILAKPGAQTSSKTENGFASATYWVADEEDGTSKVVRASWQEKTGLVTFYSVSTDKKPANPAECLEAYKKYLGVDTLTDWTRSSGTEQSEYSWSIVPVLSVGKRQHNLGGCFTGAGGTGGCTLRTA